MFRPVVVIVPDLQQICEIMLFSEGFLTAKILAKKMTVLYKLSREQLSKQTHYDFGLRALKESIIINGLLQRLDQIPWPRDDQDNIWSSDFLLLDKLLAAIDDKNDIFILFLFAKMKKVHSNQ